MINIYCSPLGVSLRNKFIDQITTNSLHYGQELLLLPSNFLMQEVRQTAAIKVSSFDSLVLDILNCFTSDKVTSINRFAQELLISSIINELANTGALKYFTPICQTKTFHANILAIIGDFMRAGVTSTELSELLHQANAEDVELSAKGQDLLLIFSKYHEQLQSRQVLDLELYYQLVIRLLRIYRLQDNEQIMLPWQKIYLSDFYHFSTLQLEILKSLEYFCPLEINLVYEKHKTHLFFPTRPSLEFLQGLPHSNLYFSRDTIEKVPELEFLCENLETDNIEKFFLPQIDAVKITTYKTRDQEMRTVIASIKEQILAGANYRDFLIIVRNVNNYSLLQEFACAAGVSISLGKSISLRQTSLCRLVMNFLQIKNFNVSKEIITGFYTSPIFKQLNALPIELLEKLFYETNILSYSDIQHLKPTEPFSNLHQEFFQELIHRLDNIPTQATPTKYIALLQEFVRFLNIGTTFGKAYQNNALSLNYLKATLLAEETLTNCLCEMQKTYEFLNHNHKNISLQDFITEFSEQAKGKELLVQVGNPNGLRVVSASDVQGVIAPFVYILGLTEGEFPQFEKDNWLLSESEKFALGLPNFPTLTLAIAEDNYFFATACATATKKLFLSAVPNERASISNYLIKITQLLTNKNNNLPLSIERSVDDLPTLENIFDKKTLLNYCASYLSFDSKNSFLQKILSDHLGPDFLQKYLLDTQRLVGKSIYHGHLLATDLLQTTQNLVGKKFSASNLEIYALCPFKYLVEKIWQVNDWDEIDDFGDSRSLGTIYHNVLAIFLKKYTSQNLCKFVTIDLVNELKEIWLQEQKKLLLQEHGALEKVLALRGEEAWLNLEKWLYKEIYWQKNTPQNILPLFLEQEFTFNLNNIVLNGRIDRIDSNGTHFVVLDYKSGGHPNKKDLLSGHDLQLPIYLLGTFELLVQKKLLSADPYPVIGGTYFSLRKGLHATGWWNENAEGAVPYASKTMKELPVWEDLYSQTESLITTYVKNIYNGIFPPQENPHCQYCSAKNICRKSSETLENGDDD